MQNWCLHRGHWYLPLCEMRDAVADAVVAPPDCAAGTAGAGTGAPVAVVLEAVGRGGNATEHPKHLAGRLEMSSNGLSSVELFGTGGDQKRRGRTRQTRASCRRGTSAGSFWPNAGC